MSNRYRNNTFVRRQGPPPGATECIRTSTNKHTWCKQANDCDCTADENDWMWGWINADCGSVIFDWWKADLVARCPYAFIDDRPAAPAPPRTTSTPRPAPTPTPTPRPTPKTSPRPPAATTPAAQTRPVVVVTSTSRAVAPPTTERAPPPGQVNEAPPPEPGTTIEEVNEVISESLLDPQIVPSSLVRSTILTDTLLSEVSAGLSQDPNGTAAAQSTQAASDSNSNEEVAPTNGVSEAPTENASQDLSIATSSNSVSSGVPLLGPLDPSSPGQVSKLNGGVIAGLIIAVLAVIAIFLALWYRSHRRRQRSSIQTYQFSSPMPTTFDGPSGSDAWTQFGGAKGSMIPSNHEEESEKVAPIYNMFSRRALPSSPMMSSIRGGQSLASVTPSSSRQLSGKVNRSSGRGMLSSMKSKWNDGGRTPPPPYLNDDGSLASPKLYKRPHGTSFFARLLSNPVPRVPVPVQAVYVGPKLPHPHFNASQLVTQSLQTLSEEREPRHSDDSRVSSQALSLPFEVDENSGREDLAPFPPSMLPGKTPADSVYEGYSRTLLSRPSFAWTDKSLPRDMSVFEEGEEVDDPRAASTRAPSLDLTWVTQGDARISVPSWAAPRKRYSTRSKKSSKSAHNRSDHRHSIMSTMTSPSIALSKSTHTSSSGPSRSAHSSTGPIPDMPSFHSIPSFRLDLGLDKAKPSSSK